MLNPASEASLKAIAAELPHALLVSGPVGIGLRQVAERIAAETGARLEWVLPEKKEVIDRAEGTINVAVIRRLYDQTKTKSTTRRLIVIDRAETMSHQAQNAFLKLLEEPATSVHFVLLAEDTGAFLPTVVSRSQRLMIKPITRAQSEQLLDSLSVTDPTKRAQLLFLAEGLPEMIERLATDEEFFAQRTAIIKDARTVVQGGRYDAMKQLNAYKDSRDKALLLLEAVMKLLEMSLKQEGGEARVGQLSRFLAAHEAIVQNGNIRLHLMAAVV